MHISAPTWFAIHFPRGNVATAARHKYIDECTINIQGIIGTVWQVARGPRTPFGSQRQDPQATPQATHGGAQPAAPHVTPTVLTFEGPREWIINGFLTWHRPEAQHLSNSLEGSHQAALRLIELLGAATNQAVARYSASWISEHIRAMIRKKRNGKAIIWNWDIVIACVMLESTDFPQALRDSKHNARQIMARCNWSGAERRAPLRAWSDGMSKMEPGADYPGRDARTHTAGKDMTTGFLVLDKEANDALVKAIDHGRQELQQEQDAASGPRAHPRQPPPPPQPGNSHAGPSGAKDNSGNIQPNNGQDRSQDGKSTSTPMDTSGTTVHCSVPDNSNDMASIKQRPHQSL